MRRVNLSRFKLKALKARARRPRSQRVPGRRMRNFGVNKARYLLAVPILLVLILAAAFLEQPSRLTARFDAAEPCQANPLMGWAVDAREDPDSVPFEHSLVYATLTWRDFEPVRGEYDFDSFEKENHLDQWRARGKRLVLRFVMDVSSQEEHMDIPDWLYAAMGENPGTWYAGEAGQGFSPNYTDWTLRSCHEQAISALGARYDGQGFLAFVEIGSLGHNGSWRAADVEAEWAMPPAEDLIYWAWQYQNAFPNTLLLMSGNYQSARIGALGLYNDALGDETRTLDWVETIAQGGYDYQVGAELRSMPGALERVATGARFDASVDQAALLADGGASLLRQLSLSRPGYVSGLNLADAAEASELLSAAGSMLGYRLWVREARYARARRAGYRLRVDLDLRNDGTTILPGAWPLSLSLIQGGEIVAQEISSLDTRSLTPGKHKIFLTLDVPKHLKGACQVGLSILNPDTGESAVALAMDAPRQGLIYLLGDIEIT